jgi:C4-dicarboxylate transporter DctM subunit
MAALVLIGLPVLLLCLGVPIFVALIAAASIGMSPWASEPWIRSISRCSAGSTTSRLLAVPLFIFAGEIMGAAGSRAAWWNGRYRSSAACAARRARDGRVVGALRSMSGSSVGCVAAIGRLMVRSSRAGLQRRSSPAA